MLPLIIVAAVLVVALSLITTLIMAGQPPRIGFLGDFAGALIVWTCVVFGLGALAFGIIRLVRVAWGS